MFLLNKKFLYNYLYKYKAPYKHKFRIIFNNIFRFLNLLQNTNLTIYDIHFLIGSDEDTNDTQKIARSKLTLKNDVYKIYEIYKESLCREISGWVDNLYFTTSGSFIINLILAQGPYHIDRIIKIEFNRKKIKSSHGALEERIQEEKQEDDKSIVLRQDIGPSCNIRLSIDKNMKIIWPDTINKYLQIRHNFDTFEEFFD
jgi:hypothetical protein